MDIMDTNPQGYDQKSVSPYPTITRIGLIGGACFIVFALLTNMFMREPTQGTMIKMLLPFAIFIGIVVFAIRKHKNEDLGGYITFGRAFLVGLLAILLTSLVSGVFDILLRTLIDPTLSAFELEQTRMAYEKANFSEEQIEQFMKYAEMGSKPMVRLLVGIGISAFIGAIVSAISAAFMQKERPASV